MCFPKVVEQALQHCKMRGKRMNAVSAKLGSRSRMQHWSQTRALLVLDVPSGCRAFTGGFTSVIIATPPSTSRVVRGPCDIAVSEDEKIEACRLAPRRYKTPKVKGAKETIKIIKMCRGMKDQRPSRLLRCRPMFFSFALVPGTPSWADLRLFIA